MNVIQYFEKVIEVEGEQEEYYVVFGEAYFNMGNIEMVVEYFEEVIVLNEFEVWYWILLVIFFMENGQAEVVMDVLEFGMEVVLGIEIFYCWIVCLFVIGQCNVVFYWLGEVFQEDFGMYFFFFELMLDL